MNTYLCIGGPLDGQRVDVEDNTRIYVTPVQSRYKRTSVENDEDTAPAFDEVIYVKVKLADPYDTYIVMTPMNMQNGLIGHLLRNYRGTKK